ncbi:hypothetical protein [Thermococcus pacificus]|uniref:Uncharacterized protein n=1 Tax=Thermococcus pacificus TaxID=71998 RepID=A0A218P7M9_9EURY|nr:hypothetical protein [Thermococcus pacificus]ASJ06779.1 hypothetical protein A3L08_05330 [Thermococcus pacificus]
MTSIAIRVPEGVDIEFAKRLAKLVEKRLAELTELNRLLSDSELTDEDMGEVIKEFRTQRRS